MKKKKNSSNNNEIIKKTTPSVSEPSVSLMEKGSSSPNLCRSSCSPDAEDILAWNSCERRTGKQKEMIRVEEASPY